MTDEDKHLATIERLRRRIDHLQAENRRIAEELDYRDEKIRVLERAILRITKGTPDVSDRPS